MIFSVDCSKKMRWGGRRRQTDFNFFLGGGAGGARQKGVRSLLQVGADTMEDTMIDFRKVIYENVEKQHCLPNKHIYIYE